jgi:hypothetical protein
MLELAPEEIRRRETFGVRRGAYFFDSDAPKFARMRMSR